MKTIPIAGGHVAIVDDEDYAALASMSWEAVRSGSNVYAMHRERRGGRRGGVYMHRIILNAKPGEEVDHANGTGLDNRRENIRICTRSLNMHNVAARAGFSSPYKGVHLCKATGRWRAQIRLNGVRISLGRFDTGEEAARAYAERARAYAGARLAAARGAVA